MNAIDHEILSPPPLVQENEKKDYVTPPLSIPHESLVTGGKVSKSTRVHPPSVYD